MERFTSKALLANLSLTFVEEVQYEPKYNVFLFFMPTSQVLYNKMKKTGKLLNIKDTNLPVYWIIYKQPFLM